MREKTVKLVSYGPSDRLKEVGCSWKGRRWRSEKATVIGGVGEVEKVIREGGGP
jgi:hypothetical protein